MLTASLFWGPGVSVEKIATRSDVQSQRLPPPRSPRGLLVLFLREPSVVEFAGVGLFLVIGGHYMAGLSGLRGAKLKLDRAHQYLDLLSRQIQSFIESNPYTFLLDPNPEPPHYLMRGYIKRLPPDEWGLIIGDFAHNTRSVLDLIVYQLSSLPSSHEDRAGLGFPIITKELNYPQASQRKLIGVCDAQRAFITGCQPYHTRSSTHIPALELLQEINNADKHRVVQTVGALASIDNVCFRGAGGVGQWGSNVIHGEPAIIKLGKGASITGSMGGSTTIGFEYLNDGVISENGTPVADLTLGGPANVNVHVDHTVEIKFGEADPRIQGRPVVATLTFIYDRIKEVLGETEHRFFA